MAEGGARASAKADDSGSAALPEEAVEQKTLRTPAGNRAFAGWARRTERPPAGGRPLDPELAAQLEPAFGEDLSDVRVHDDAEAAAAAHDVNARAFTLGEHVVLDASLRDVLGAAGGRELLAHELAHVLQQRRGGVRAPGPAPDSAVETEAETAAASVAAGEVSTPLAGSAAGVARAPRDVASLSETELAAEHAATQRWLLDHPTTDPSYQETLDYFQRLEGAVNKAPTATTSGGTTSSTASAGAASGADVPPTGAGADPLVSVDPSTPLTPEDMVSHVLDQRGWSANEPGTLNVQGKQLGMGYSTNSIVQVVDANGNQVATEWGQFNTKKDLHAEMQALDALEARLGGKQIPGGKIVVAVDQLPCPRCAETIREFARRHGLEVIEVYGPGRSTIPNPAKQASTKTAATTAYSGKKNQPPTQTELLYAESILTSGGGNASPVTPAVDPAATGTTGEQNFTPRAEPEPNFTPARPTEPTPPVSTEKVPAGPVVEKTPAVTPLEGAPATGGGKAPWLEMVPGSGEAAFQFGLGLAYMYTHPKAIAAKRDEEGFAPVGPDPNENKLLQIGRFLMDPSMDDAVPAASRFNLPVWRKKLVDLAGAKSPGQKFKMSWEREKPGLLPGMVSHDSIDVEYVKQPDGTYSPGRVLDDDYKDFTPPDINRVIDPTVPNDSIMYMLSDHSKEA